MGSLKEILPVKFNIAGINRLIFDWKAGEEAFPNHFHERPEFLFIVSGELHLFIDDKEYIAKAEQTVIISPFVKHMGIAGDNGVKYHVITFRNSDFTNATMASKKYLATLTRHIVAFEPVNDHPAIIHEMKKLITYLDFGNNLNPLCAMGKIYEILGLFFQHAAVSHKNMLKDPQEDNFNEVIQYLDINFLSDISTRDISEKFGYNTSYFCRKFKSETGITVMSYIRDLRLEYGKNMLLVTNDSINSIALKSGFSDKSHFSNSFKKRYKISPAKYRKEHRKDDVFLDDDEWQ